MTALARPGDFVFLDPPYDGTYTGYTAGGFDLAAQVALADEVQRLTALGVKIVLTNADTPIIRELYSRHTIREVAAPRSISCKGDRAPAAELLVTNEEAFATW
ncbi:Modification methylase DpnIIA [compost metagenome]